MSLWLLLFTRFCFHLHRRFVVVDVVVVDVVVVALLLLLLLLARPNTSARGRYGNEWSKVGGRRVQVGLDEQEERQHQQQAQRPI